MSGCLTPIRLPLKGLDGFVLHECGKCYNCQNLSRGEWALRAKEELKSRPYVFFLTLTYNNESLKKYCFNIRYNKFLKKYVDFDFDYNTGEVLDKIRDVDVDKYVFDVSCNKFFNRRWDYALLRKDHLTDFLADINMIYRKYFPYMFYEVESQLVNYCYMGKKVKLLDSENIEINGEKYLLKNHINGLYVVPGHMQHKQVKVIEKFKKLSKFKYYATGEYGDTTHRPHY